MRGRCLSQDQTARVEPEPSVGAGAQPLNVDLDPINHRQIHQLLQKSLTVIAAAQHSREEVSESDLISRTMPAESISAPPQDGRLRRRQTGDRRSER